MPSEAEVIESAMTAIEGILTLPILERHQRDLINGKLWKLTEARGKYTTRYRSKGALDAPPGTTLQHEHVTTRKQLVNETMKHPKRAREIAKTAIGCVVIKEERRALTRNTRERPGTCSTTCMFGCCRAFSMVVNSPCDYHDHGASSIHAPQCRPCRPAPPAAVRH